MIQRIREAQMYNLQGNGTVRRLFTRFGIASSATLIMSQVFAANLEVPITHRYCDVEQRLDGSGERSSDIRRGHAFGAGFMFALCHDVRLMRADRGFVCANEMQLGMRIPVPELALFKHKLSANVFFETVQLAKRWAGPMAEQAGIVHGIASLEELPNQVVVDLDLCFLFHPVDEILSRMIPDLFAGIG